MNNYYASEVNADSIKVANENYPNIIQLGDIECLIKINEEGNIVKTGKKLKDLPKIDLLLGGSPCQGISRSKTEGRLNLKDPRSRLFFNYIAIRDWLIENNNPKLKFLLENVKPSIDTLNIMNDVIGTQPYIINSSYFSAQDRLRLYWTNFTVNLDDIKDKNIYIKDILDNSHDEKINSLKDIKYIDSVVWGNNYVKWDTGGKGYYSQQNRARYLNKKINTLPKSNSGDKTRIYLGEYKYRNASVLELERCQTLPDEYTNCINSKPKRRGIIGDGWTVDVIVHILQHLK